VSVRKLTLDFIHALALARITLCICYLLHLIAVGARRVLNCALVQQVLRTRNVLLRRATDNNIHFGSLCVQNSRFLVPIARILRVLA